MERCFKYLGLIVSLGVAASFVEVAAGTEGSTPLLTDSVARVPVLVGEPWQITGSPDLGEFTSPRQQPVDFGIWQAADDTWQLWSCIRSTKCGGMTRLFYRWEGKALTDRDWKPMGITMQAEPKYGETPGGLQAPFVIRDPAGGKSNFLMFYGDWVNLRLAQSSDGKTFTRRLLSSDTKPKEPRASARAADPAAENHDRADRTGMFSEGVDANTRDPMVIRLGNRWYCYYTAHPGKKGTDCCRTSDDLLHWSEPTVVARGGQAGTGPSSAECPFVVDLDGYFYLFRTQRYGEKSKTSIYRSRDPMNFGVDSDEFFVEILPVAAPEIIQHAGKWYLACLLPSLKGMQIYPMQWRVAGATQPARP